MTVTAVDDERQVYTVEGVGSMSGRSAEFRPTVMNASFVWNVGSNEMPLGGADRKEARAKRIDQIFARLGVEI